MVISRSGDRQAGGAERGSRASFIVRYCIGHANHRFRPSREHGDPHLRRTRRAAERRRLDRPPPRPRQPARARFPRGHPHPAIRGRSENGGIDPKSPVTVTAETPVTARLDGGRGFGQVVARRGTEMAIAKAKASGLAAVGLSRTTHVGRLADYAEMAARQGLVGMLWVNAVHGLNVAPWGGAARRLGTNPTPSAFRVRTAPPWCSISPRAWWRRGRCA